MKRNCNTIDKVEYEYLSAEVGRLMSVERAMAVVALLEDHED